MPFSPCGLAVDVLRSAYVTKARFFKDSDHESEIVWYQTDCDFLDVPTTFHSLNWDDNYRYSDRGGIGEIGGRPRKWLSGASDWTPVCGGKLGSPDQFLHGAAWSGLEIPWDADHPACCDPCPAFLNCPLQFRAELSGFDPDLGYGAANGTFLCDPADALRACQWTSPGVPAPVTVTVITDDSSGQLFCEVAFTSYSPLLVVTYQRTFPFPLDQTSYTLDLDSVTEGDLTGFPPTVTVGPSVLCSPVPPIPPTALVTEAGDVITDESLAPILVP